MARRRRRKGREEEEEEKEEKEGEEEEEIYSVTLARLGDGGDLSVMRKANDGS